MNKGVYITIGASNHTKSKREDNDFYATDPIAIDKLEQAIKIPHNVWECACGQGHLSERLIEYGHNVVSSDLVDRGYGTAEIDFLGSDSISSICGDCKDICILTNPPYKLATEFILHALNILPNGAYAMFLLKTTFLEGKRRYEQIFSQNPPKLVLQFAERLLCAKNGDFERMRAGGGSAVAYAWYIWQKSDEHAHTIIDWI